MEGSISPVGGSSGLRLATTGETVIVEVHGILDEAAVRAIRVAATGVLDSAEARVRVDLGHLEGFTEDGVAAFASLQSRLARGADDRIAYQARTDVGQRALLAAYARLS